ncbi:TPA: prepilin-type cleavage/methylation domain-containing protein [Campylobacter jejuni]|nr:prepilin-type cleavage/methylation domain-containing protein [Campylobacter jejuni]
MIKAFSLLEFVFIILILGIVFNLGSLYLKKDNLLEGAIQILNDIQYTQSLAMMQEGIRVDELAIAKREWYKSRWQLYFINSAATNYEQTYTIFLDKNGDGNANLGKTEINIDREIAVDIINPKKLMNSGQSGVIDKSDSKTTQRFNIFKKFGIKKVEFKGSCRGSTRIVFDERGRLYSPLRTSQGVYDKNLAKTNQDCIIRLSSIQANQICIIVNPLSGFAYIPKFQDFNKQMIMINGATQCSKI